MSARQFPILVPRDRRGRPLPDCPKSVAWDVVEPHEAQARENHDQSLKRLAERGGLSPLELLAVLTDRPWASVRDMTEEEAIKLVNQQLGPGPASFAKPHFDALLLELIRTKVCPGDLSDAELNALRAAIVSLGTKLQYLKTDKLRATLGGE